MAHTNLIKDGFSSSSTGNITSSIMSYTHNSLPYSQQDDMEFTFNHYPSDRLADSAAEGRTVLYPSQLHPHPLFTRQGDAGPSIQNRSLDQNLHHSLYQSTPQNTWPPYDHPQSYSLNYTYPTYPTPSPFPPPRLSPPPIHHTQINFKSPQNNSPTSSQSTQQRLTLAGSLDPSTGIFYRTPEHPRLRTAQACEKCRTRKAKCSGEHPACKRCLTRGLVCEYAKEGRVRGPNKAKSKSSNSGRQSSLSLGPYPEPHLEQHMHLQKNMAPASASAPPFVSSPSASHISMKMDLDMTSVDPTLSCGPRSALAGSASMPIEPVWVDHLGQVNAYPRLNSNSEHQIQGADERGQNELSTQVGAIEGSVFVKDCQGLPDSQQNHFHGQYHSHNETSHHHYPALDLQMC